ncbi:hypothetical protein RclHR1_15950004 [Rhizophagus clarus]|uniref:NYN domain-containing protein n=1 Tax=Rhizophagus clarus TaxID=94130 RepID=A0A2Z6QGG8_9GLOM|nr:hypothetical protein RclHR1_15950004 [Rhizophagus clarus]GES87559.1 hypothetical protein GLOIN_2v1883790 [Rhizophagus clarus]
MMQSFNCLLLNTDTLISIPIFNDSTGRFTMLDQQQKVHLDNFKVKLLRNDICRKKNVDNSNNMKLWKVNVKREDIKNKNVSTNEEIVKLIDGKEMKLGELFKEYFQDELNDQKFEMSNIHVIATTPDNSNLLTEGIYSVGNCVSHRLDESQVTIDYGMLVGEVKVGRKLGNEPVIAGSSLSPDDSVFKKDYNIKVFERKERVDNFLTLKMAETFRTKSPGTLVLISGDGDYFETLLEAINLNWKVEVWFWEWGILNSLRKKHEPSELCKHHLFPIRADKHGVYPIGTNGENKIKYKPLEPCFEFFVIGIGPILFKDKEVVE